MSFVKNTVAFVALVGGIILMIMGITDAVAGEAVLKNPPPGSIPGVNKGAAIMDIVFVCVGIILVFFSFNRVITLFKSK